MSDNNTRTVYFTMILHPARGWMRVGNAFGSRSSAKEWLPFVSSAWHGMRAKVARCTIRFEGAIPDQASRKVLDEKFNLDVPAAPVPPQGPTT